MPFASEVRRELVSDKIVLLSPLHSICAPKSVFGGIHDCLESGERLSNDLSYAELAASRVYLRKLRSLGMLQAEAPQIEFIDWRDRARAVNEPTSRRKPVVVFRMEETAPVSPSALEFEKAARHTLSLRRPPPGVIEFLQLDAIEGTLRPMPANKLTQDIERRYLLRALDLVRPAPRISQTPIVVVSRVDQPNQPWILGLCFHEMAVDTVCGSPTRGDALFSWLDSQLQFEALESRSVLSPLDLPVNDRQCTYLKQVLNDQVSSNPSVTLESDRRGLWKTTTAGSSFSSLCRERVCFEALLRLAALRNSAYDADRCSMHCRYSWWWTPSDMRMALRRHRTLLGTLSGRLTRKETLFGTRYAVLT
jgi:hypothetical protein